MQKQTQAQKDITLYTLYHCEWQLPPFYTTNIFSGITATFL